MVGYRIGGSWEILLVLDAPRDHFDEALEGAGGTAEV